MRQWWLAAVLGGSFVSVVGTADAQSLQDPPVIQGIGPSPTRTPRHARSVPRASYAEPPAFRPADAGGLFGLIFGAGENNYAARYNGPAPDESYAGYPAQPDYGYAPQPPSPRYTYAAREPAAGYAYGPGATAAPQRRALDTRFARQEVAYNGREPAGTIVIDTPNKYLYLVLGPQRAIRYGIGVGRPGFTWSGVKTITRKAEWPAWTPPPEMLLRRPDLPTHMEGGPGNPLGARAMYLGSSMYRIHGTTEPETIGTNVSSGCIRLINEDVIDLYQRVRIGTKVIVL